MRPLSEHQSLRTQPLDRDDWTYPSLHKSVLHLTATTRVFHEGGALIAASPLLQIVSASPPSG